LTNVVLFDGYAGPGVFEDNEPGSPLIMCQAAEKTTPGNYQAFFVNKRAKHHNKLESILLPGISVDRLSGRLFPRGLLVPVALPKPLIGTFTTRTAQLAQIFCTAPNVKTA